MEGVIMQAYNQYLNEGSGSKGHVHPTNNCQFITNFNYSYKSIKHIINKHCTFQIMTPKLAPVLPKAPQVIFKKAWNLKNFLAPSKMLHGGDKFATRHSFDHRVGVFKCRKPLCLTCQFISHGQSSFQITTGTVYPIKQFITCSTEYVDWKERVGFLGCHKQIKTNIKLSNLFIHR